jgi:alpha-tubulin suppressor-like RCC1 family protein
MSYLYFYFWLVRAPNKPNAVLPLEEGIAATKPDGIIVSFGLDYVAIVKENGELWVWGIDNDPPTEVSYDHTSQKAWKLADHVLSAVPVGMDTHLQGGVFLSALYEDTSLWIWDIMRSSSHNIIQTPQIIMEGVSNISAHSPQNSSFFALKTNRSLWIVWKERDNPELSSKDKDFKFEKKMDGVNAFWVNPVENAQVYALKGDGTLFGFGENAQGQLGVGFSSGNAKRIYHKKPTSVTDSVVSVITQGEFADLMVHTMAIKDDRSLWLWGQDIWFDQSTKSLPLNAWPSFYSNTPIKIMDGVASAAMGTTHSLVIKQDSSLWTWGYNNSGQLGIGSYEHIKEPAKIMDNVVSVTASNSHSLALQADGSLWAWGNNSLGQLGTGDTASRLEPTKIMEDVASIFTAAACNAAVKRDGSVWIWGNTALYPGSFATEGDSILEPICILE